LGSVIGGGHANITGGSYSTVPGGLLNSAEGDYSFASGRRAKANHNGAFVWADQTDVDFASTGDDQFLIRALGGVGIGTNSPDANLHLNSSNWTQTIFENVDDNARGYLGLDWRALTLSNNAFWTGSSWSFPADNEAAFALLFHRNNQRMEFRVRPSGGSLNPAMIINTDENVGIGTLTPGTFRLAVNGSAAKPGGGSWSNFSDNRLKRDIKQIEPGILDHLLTLRGYTFEYLDHAIENRLALPGRQIGLIAQEVMAVFPEWVDTDDEGYLYITERGTTAMFIEALREIRKEKNSEIESLHTKLEEKYNWIHDLERRIESLENIFNENFAGKEKYEF